MARFCVFIELILTIMDPISTDQQSVNMSFDEHLS